MKPSDLSWEALAAELVKRSSNEENVGETVALLGQIARSLVQSPSYPAYFRLWEEQGIHLTPVHFYSPIPDTRSMKDALWERAVDLPAVDLNVAGQLELVCNVFPRYRDEYESIPMEPSSVGDEFFLVNGMFGGSDALACYCMIRHFEPNLVIEVGSGHSSRLIARAALENGHTKLVCIEPHPSAALSAGFPGLSRLVPQRVQEVDPTMFGELKANDVLFIDSSHVVCCGSDVNYLFLEVIPHLAKGVLIHVHDVFLPGEYPESWVKEKLRFWSEQYLLQAFLAFNGEFEVLLCNSFLGQTHQPELKQTFPTSPWWSGGSFWIRRKPETAISRERSPSA